MDDPWLTDSSFLSQGMGDSKEFAGELFAALARRRNLEPEDGITKEQLKEFWEEMTDQNFDSRLRIFFDMLRATASRSRANEEFSYTDRANPLIQVRQERRWDAHGGRSQRGEQYNRGSVS